MSKLRLSLCLTLPLGLISCVAPPAATSPRADDAAAWTSAGSYVSEPAGPTISPDDWLTRFNDPALQTYVQRVLANNLDLQQAAVRVDSARLNAVQAVGDRLPEIEASLRAARTRSASQQFGSVTDNRYSVSLGLSWEIDLWGKLRNSAKAAVADFQAQQETYYGARLSLVANAARAWFDAIALHQQLSLAQRSYETYQNGARLIQNRYESGTSDALDLRLALANAASAKALVASRQQSYAAALRNLEVLAGSYPAGKIISSDTLPALPERIPSGLPGDLLTRRPDIMAAERSFAAAEQRALRARKDMLPSITLTGDAGGSSDELDSVFTDSNFVWSLVGGLLQPIFYGGQLRAQAGIASNTAEIAALDYAQTVLDALREVEQALASETYLYNREEAARVAMEQAKAAEDLAWQQYIAGIDSDIFAVLESQRRSINAQTDYIDVLNARLQNRIDLHVALGGSFSTEPIDSEVNSQPVSPLDLIGP